MSSEFEKEIKEEVLVDKALNFFTSYKVYILIIVFLLILFPITYQIKILLDKQKNEQELEILSSLIANYEDDVNENLNAIKKLTLSKNTIISSFSINKILDSKIIKKEEKINLLNNILKNKNLSTESIESLKIKKALLIFDNIDEAELLNLLNNKNKIDNYRNINLRLIYDFYLSKGQYNKAEEFKKNLNEK